MKCPGAGSADGGKSRTHPSRCPLSHLHIPALSESPLIPHLDQGLMGGGGSWIRATSGTAGEGAPPTPRGHPLTARGTGTLLRTQAAPRGTVRTRRSPVFRVPTRHSHTLVETRPPKLGRIPRLRASADQFHLRPTPSSSASSRSGSPIPGTASGVLLPAPDNPPQLPTQCRLPLREAGPAVARRLSPQPRPCAPYPTSATVGLPSLLLCLQRYRLLYRGHRRSTTTCA